MRRKEMEDLLAERSDRIALLEQRIDNMQHLLDGYREREQSIIDSLANANDTAKKRIAEAEEQAAALVASAESSAGATLQNAETRASELISCAEEQAKAYEEGAERKAKEWTRSARIQAEETLDAAEREAKRLQADIDRYNAVVAACAAEAERMADKFAEFFRDHAADPNALPVPEADAPAESAPPAEEEPVFRTGAAAVSPADLPEPEDPAQLMQNIYKLQNRDLPDSVEDSEEGNWGEKEAARAEEADAYAETDEAAEEELADYAPRPEPEYDPMGEDPAEEWQPEAEPDVPTVSDLMPDGTDDTDISLDALLDEIIKAGE